MSTAPPDEPGTQVPTPADASAAEDAPPSESDETRPSGSEDAHPSGSEDAGAVPVRRRRRRATGGTPAPAVEPGGLLPGRSQDDTDTGWGERPPADDDERFLRDVPPHW